ncbi:MAG TPA: monovalent cation/H+ antiporter complex subunit F [Myxococcota bacterium]|nr:monovalent cation/H+ antiporter complex subunit F [Myxococcota bacterium]
MAELALGVASFLLLTIGVALLRVVWGPTRSDRMLMAQLWGTGGVAILLLLSEASNAPVLEDVALVFALLASVVALAFVRRGFGERP